MNMKCRKWGWTLAGVIALGAQSLHAQQGGGPVGGEVGNTDDSSEFGNPCSSETARNKIVEKIFAFQKETSPLVLDRKTKEKLLASLDEILSGKSPELNESEKAALKTDATIEYCSRAASKSAGIEAGADSGAKKAEFDKLFEDIKKKAERGELSAEAQAEIDALYKDHVAQAQYTMDTVHGNQQTPEVKAAAVKLRKKLASTNTLRQSEIKDLGEVLSASANPYGPSHVMLWDYDTEKDAKTGEEFLVAYQAMYSGGSCNGYVNEGRVTAMPSFKIPLKHFDRNKIGAWVNNAFIPGYGEWHMDSIPIKLASLNELCPAKVTGVMNESTKAKASKTKHGR